jgi:hypothetical protein
MKGWPRLLVFWLVVAGAVVALPVAVCITGQVRGEHVPVPGAHEAAPGLSHLVKGFWIGQAFGVPLTLILLWLAGQLRGR